MGLGRRFYALDPIGDLKYVFEMMQPADLLYVGIDPGLQGSIAFLPNNKTIDPVIMDLPVIKAVSKTRRVNRKTGKVTTKVTRTFYDHTKITKIFDPVIDNVRRVYIALERGSPRPEDSVTTAFSVGVGFGMWGLYFSAFGLSYDEIQPAVWKRRMGLWNKEKGHSRMLATRLFPGAARYLSEIGDHNRAEALLLAEDLRRVREARK